MRRPRIVIAGAHSGAGKTTVTLGLMAALRRRGHVVQGFKAGPDYIDPSYHTAVTGRPSRNLDTWMLPPAAVCEVFHRGSEGAEVSVIEGVMGLYDGKDPRADTGSTAEVSRLLEAPVVLVIDASRMARSAAAVVLGFQRLDPRVRIAGVIANRVGGPGHLEIVRQAVEPVCGVPVLGGLARQAELTIPERHLGLIPALERGELDGLFHRLADAVEAAVDVGRVLALAEAAEDWTAPDPVLFRGQPRPEAACIALARDAAFNFYYPENLELLEWHGARLVTFRPLAGEPVPAEADGVYIGGGFPEEFAAELSRQEAVRESLRRAVAAGMPVFAECGGFMYLCEALTDRAGETHAMAGVVPARVRMQDRLAALGYREVTALRDTLLLPAGERARGHEFHYSVAEWTDPDRPAAWRVEGSRGGGIDGYADGGLVAGYTHLHFGSNPEMAPRFVAACAAWRRARKEGRG
ncbi:cobyrinate a,c-diamide synthase [Alicyclobacillus macrosporangiidus]|uniref:cobyrinate a,c-diamide synthase n=1 Tax=Alicyclobacillus macrosporangiidus TaxID=392015 RepID=UPI000495C382|nr:cobyrinate a,c-diamide synthase [Alicyclobacillus macrosporangiidus]